ncbi:DoxX family protein [Pengzhenrongella sicca]|uniref:DoxX family membrane protein n=1 Tax=Pengzhenrongella sicca TaxID=2819238 RepID=A0A8A4ZCG8_9MICO|nr:DoxX family protein [Pengzhenrongella sicca]QTE29690.1 hypothetical protein J4E96_01140 [Pengzhenrongella sicca]
MADDDAAPARTLVTAAGLAALLAAAGAAHFVRPRPFESLIPRALGNPRAWVLASGAAELACAVAVAVPRTRRVGGLASAALFVAVFPGNVTMALAAHPGGRSWASSPAIAWGRLPLQVPLVAWALAVARAADRG